jgi:hypothetical protein
MLRKFALLALLAAALSLTIPAAADPPSKSPQATVLKPGTPPRKLHKPAKPGKLLVNAPNYAPPPNHNKSSKTVPKDGSLPCAILPGFNLKPNPGKVPCK